MVARKTAPPKPEANGGPIDLGKVDKAMIIAQNKLETPTVAQVNIQAVRRETIAVRVTGISPLIMNRFSEKAKKQMLDNAQGRKNPKEPKDPEAEYLAAFYRLENGFGFPAVGFKSAMVGAARYFGKALPMTVIRQAVFLHGTPSPHDNQLLVPITGEPHMREDVVTVGNGGHDLRYRPEFPDWSADLKITFVSSLLTRDSVLNILDAAGFGVGVGEWRPEKDGMNGCFQIDLDAPITQV